MVVACATAPAAVAVVSLCMEHRVGPEGVRYRLSQSDDQRIYITISIDETVIRLNRLHTAIQAIPDTAIANERAA